MKRKSSYPFWLGLYVFAGIAAICAVMAVLWKYCEAFEQAQPENVINAYVNYLNEKRWTNEVVAAVDALSQRYQSSEECRSAVDSYLSEPVHSSLVLGSNNEEQRSYLMISGTRRIGEVTLVRDTGNELSFGFVPWKISEISFDFSALRTSKEITVPENYRVFFRGVELGEDTLVGEGAESELLKEFYAETENTYRMVTYRVEYVQSEQPPVFTVQNARGESVELLPDADEEQFFCVTDETQLASLEDFAERFCSVYYSYTSGYTRSGETTYDSYYRLSYYLIPGSELAQRLYSAADGLYWTSTSAIRVYNVKISNVLAVGDGLTAMDIESDVSVSNSGGTNETHNRVRCLIREENGDRRIVSMKDL